MRDYYAAVYPSFNRKQFDSLAGIFHLDMKRRVNSFSKGMKKQVSILLGLCAGTKYLLCDETFDGLDPVVRQAVKSLIAAEMVSRDFTPVIASHNLRELEDFCDSIGLLHQGKAPAHGRHRPGPQQDLQTSVRHPGSAPGAGAPAQSSRDKVRAHRLAPHTHRARGTGGSNAHRRGTGSSLS